MDKTEMLINSGLDWKVNSEPLQTVSGILIPDRIALVREDTKKVLGIHTNSYVPYRIGNSTGLELHTGGSFKGGQKVFFQLKSNDLKLGNDVIKGFISGFNTFDGTTSLGFGNSSVTVSCMNTFYRGYHEVNTRLRHSASMKPRIEEILSRIDLLMEEEKTMFREITRLSETRMTPQIKELITKMLFEISVEDRLDTLELSTRMKNNIERFSSDLHLELAEKGETLWSGMSGITRYSTHSMKQGKDNSEAKMFGRIGVIERNIYKELVEMV